MSTVFANPRPERANDFTPDNARFVVRKSRTSEPEADSRKSRQRPARQINRFSTYSVPRFEGEWLNFFAALRELPLNELIREVGALKGDGTDLEEDWDKMETVLDLASENWFQIQMSGEEWWVGPDPWEVNEIRKVLVAEIDRAISEGGITCSISESLEVEVRPKDLRSFLLLDVAEAIKSAPTYGRCKRCGLFYRAASERPRSYCSKKCRTAQNNANYVQRRKQRASESN